MYLPLSFLSFVDLNIRLNLKKHLIFNLFQVQKWRFQCYVYANSQIHVSIPRPLLKLQPHLPNCLTDTSTWMSRKHLQVNTGSSECNSRFPCQVCSPSSLPTSLGQLPVVETKNLTVFLASSFYHTLQKSVC